MPVEAEESVVWSRLANHTVGARAVGGRLLLTDRRLLFRPHVLERRFFAGNEWSAERAAIEGFDVEGPDGGPFSGGLRSRLRVTLSGGGTELFVVWSPARAARQLSEKLAGQPVSR